jgi:hypothetical protein
VDYAGAPPFAFPPFDLRGGVTGRPCPLPPYVNVFFFSAGLRIYSTHASKEQQDHQLQLFRKPRVQTHLERAQQCLVHAHHRAGIVKLPAIVGRREQRDELPFCEKLVAVLDDLVRATNEVHVVLLKEPRDDVRSESERDAAIVFRPACDVLVWVGP